MVELMIEPSSRQAEIYAVSHKAPYFSAYLQATKFLL